MNHQMLCGAGKADITLPVGTPMGGFANRLSACQGVLDPLSARALLLRSDQCVLLIITLDALAISATRARVLAQDAALACDGAVQPADVRVVCSHTHSAADLSGMFGDTGLIASYFEQVRDGVRAAARQAGVSLAAALVRQGTTDFPIGKNRRLRPGHARVSALEREQGEHIDHTLTVLRFEQPGAGPGTGRDIATLFHTACHPVCLGPENVLASGDFAGIAAQAIEKQTGAPALFLNGACGNITPIIGRGSSYAATKELGQSVAQAVMNVNLNLWGLWRCTQRTDPGGLAVSSPSTAQLPLGCHYTTEHEIAQAAAWLLQQDTGFIGWEGVVHDWQRRMCEQLAAGVLPSTIQIPLSAARIGQTTFVFLGAEVFNEYQLWQPRNVRLVGYADAEGCYIPTAAAIGGGGYEVSTAPVFYGLPCAPGPGAERALLDAIAEVGAKHRP